MNLNTKTRSGYEAAGGSCLRKPLIRSYGAVVLLTVLILSITSGLVADNTESALCEQALVTMRKAADFFYTKVASHGGYVYYYSVDLKERWAEGPATRDQIWVQPPAIAGDESQEVMQTLLEIYRFTGDRKYIEPAQRALAYLKRSLLGDGRLARFYELRTNKPLYMSRRGGVYTLTYDDSDLPKHYAWKIEPRLSDIEKQYDELLRSRPCKSEESPPTISKDRIVRIINALDNQGRWVSTYRGRALVGRPRFKPSYPYISSAVFSRNIELLSEYIISVRTR
jgi:hypothetical protein